MTADREQIRRDAGDLETIKRLEMRLATIVEKAKRARSQAFAPEYDEEAIRDALWDVVDAALEDDSG